MDHDFLMKSQSPPQVEAMIQVGVYLERSPVPRPGTEPSLNSGRGGWLGEYPQPSSSRCSSQVSVVHSFIFLHLCLLVVALHLFGHPIKIY